MRIVTKVGALAQILQVEEAYAGKRLYLAGAAQNAQNPATMGGVTGKHYAVFKERAQT